MPVCLEICCLFGPIAAATHAADISCSAAKAGTLQDDEAEAEEEEEKEEEEKGRQSSVA